MIRIFANVDGLANKMICGNRVSEGNSLRSNNPTNNKDNSTGLRCQLLEAKVEALEHKLAKMEQEHEQIQQRGLSLKGFRVVTTCLQDWVSMLVWSGTSGTRGAHRAAPKSYRINVLAFH